MNKLSVINAGLLFSVISSVIAMAEHDEKKEAGAARPVASATDREVNDFAAQAKVIRNVVPLLEDKAAFLGAMKKGEALNVDAFKTDSRWRGACVNGDYNYGKDGKLRGRYTDTGSYWYQGANLRSFKNDRAGNKGIDLDLTRDTSWTAHISVVEERSAVNRDLKKPTVVETAKTLTFSQRGDTRVTVKQGTLENGQKVLLVKEDLIDGQDLHFPRYCIFGAAGIPLSKDRNEEEGL